MRFTQVLLRFNFKRIYKQMWDSRSKKNIADPQSVVELVENDGFQVEDALEVAGTYAPIYKDSGIPKIIKYNEKEDPDWHDRICHFFSMDTCLIEGTNHAQALTKTCRINGLTPKIEEKMEKMHLNDEMKKSINNAILQAFIWDGFQSQLPKRIDPARPYHNFPLEFGIPLSRKIDILLNEFLHLTNVYYPNNDINQSKIIQENLHTSSLIEKDADLLQFRITSDYGLTCKSPLTPEEIQTNIKVPDIYPLKSTLDLQQKNVYKSIDYCSFTKAPMHRFAHTIFLTKTDEMSKWTHDQILGRAIGACFGVALAQLKAIREITTPVVVQCIQTDGKLFDFITYQLNTIDLNDTQGINNNVWIDQQRLLIDRCDYIKGNPILGRIDYEVMKKFFAFCTR